MNVINSYKHRRFFVKVVEYNLYWLYITLDILNYINPNKRMSESYFFALLPRFLKVEHSFAKTIKANTKYRIVVFKGTEI